MAGISTAGNSIFVSVMIFVPSEAGCEQAISESAKRLDAIRKIDRMLLSLECF